MSPCFNVAFQEAWPRLELGVNLNAGLAFLGKRRWMGCEPPWCVGLKFLKRDEVWNKSSK